ncbi:MAG: hypothetical protein PHD73_11000 [Sediminibacterium sp.]|nr:hypothetical protein [Sediminibacterium sp.]
MSLLITLLICSTELHAQKFEKLVDKFTGRTTYYTKFQDIYRKATVSNNVPDAVSCSIFKVSDSLYLCLSMKMGGFKRVEIAEGAKLYLKPATGPATILLAASTEQSEIIQSSYDGTSITQMYRLTDKDIDILRITQISDIRVEHTSGKIDYAIKSKKSEIIKKALTECSRFNYSAALLNGYSPP